MHLNIYIIILNWNGKEDTLECLASVQKINYPHYSVIVADNGSTDDSVVAIRAAFPDVFLLENGENLGFAEGNNRAIRYALDHGADAVLLLNNDTIVSPTLLNSLADAYLELPDAGIIGPVCLYYDRPEIIWSAGAEWDNKSLNFNYLYQGYNLNAIESQSPYKVQYVIGCAMFIHKKTLSQCQLMNPIFFLNFEELDWCVNIAAKGFSHYVIPEAQIWHKISSSFGGKLSPLKNYFLTRNFLLWASFHQPSLIRRILFKAILEFIPSSNFLTLETSKPLKMRYWEFIEWLNACRSRFKDPYYKAQFYGIYHYFKNQFNDCPIKIKNKITNSS
ncbi:glycosyltransferase family 2 protein [Methylotuvimicrobium sp. KM2]|uniref:glycosyltransferase family 2 protein n=1 Tax=Methylotuvimicrobium sp. KM2 TaxID=3133976 RepID=UPI003100B81D